MPKNQRTDFKAEYDAEHNLIASYTMDVEKFIYRVYKYSFDGYYFEQQKYWEEAVWKMKFKQ